MAKNKNTKVLTKKQLAHRRVKTTFLSFERRRNLEGIVFSIPWLIGLVWFLFIPLFMSVKMSFYNVNGQDLWCNTGLSTWVGFDNYVEVIKDPEAGQVVLNSFMSALYQVPVIVAFALFVAVLLKQKFPGRVYFRVIFFIPVILSGVIMSYLFSDNVGNISVFGQIVANNQFLSGFGGIASQIGHIMWRSSVEILIFLAALQSVPDILYEVVDLDGATAWESFWHITLPYVSPFVILNCIYALVDSFVDSTNPVMSLLNGMDKYGERAALSWLYMLMTLIVILIFILFTRRWLR
ncbi:MAG: sugar ABC transporter permease [Clostridia bacterium]|nr:sugar ABC transporter permease [Clostridia bacterium]